MSEVLLHQSKELRTRVLDEINGAPDMDFVTLLGHMVKTVEENRMKVYQSRRAGMEALALMDIGADISRLPESLMKPLLSMFIRCLMEDAETAQAAADAVLAQGLQERVVLNLLKELATRSKTERVAQYLRAVQRVCSGSSLVATAVIELMPHFSPTGLMDLQTRKAEPSCLETAVELLMTFPQSCFDVKVLEILEGYIRDPRAFATRHHAITQRERIIIASLKIIRAKHGKAIAEDQVRQEKAAADLAAASSSGSLPDGAAEPPEPSEMQLLYGRILSTAQDTMSDPSPSVRKHALEFVRAVSQGNAFPKVVAEVNAMRLQSHNVSDQAVALSNMVALAFSPSAAIDRLLEFLESGQERIREVSEPAVAAAAATAACLVLVFVVGCCSSPTTTTTHHYHHSCASTLPPLAHHAISLPSSACTSF